MASDSGKTVKGKITKITAFGAFVSVDGGGSGLIHISELTSGFVKDVKDHLSEGEQVEALVLSVDENKRYNLSLKRLAPKTDFSSPPPEYVPVKKSNDASFEDMMHRFKVVSDDKMSDLKRGYEHKRGGGKRRR